MFCYNIAKKKQKVDIMFIHLLDTTTGISGYENGKMVTVPKKVKVKLGTCGFRSFDNRTKRVDTVETVAMKMMEQQNNEVGYAIYGGTINNPYLMRFYITSEYRDLEHDLQNA